MQRSDFGNDFTWGTAVSAYQVEGAYNSHGKGLSIWDDFCLKKHKRIKNNDDGKVSCDFYNSFEKDLHILKQLGIPNFRFSVSWPRIFPSGLKQINSAGLDFYKRLINKCLQLEINPWLTLYHWDLPLALDKMGGWANRDIINWFAEYVLLVTKELGASVENWMVLNEPLTFTGAGYGLGVHAPGKKGMKNFLPALHHAALCQSIGAKIIRTELPKANIGTTFSITHLEPASADVKDEIATKKMDALINRLFIEPTLGLGYPVDDLKFLSKLDKYILQDDEHKLKFDFDFIGLQCYTREIIKSSGFVPYIGATNIPAITRSDKTTEMNWEVWPPSLYHAIKKVSAYAGVKKIIVTENGAAFQDQIINDIVADEYREKFLIQNLEHLLRAKNEGCNVKGYFIWSFLDNFEWTEGFHPRFGLVHVDHDTQRRIIKYSGYWYKKFLAGV